MYEKECKWCKEVIKVEKQPLFALHVANCKLNPNLEYRKRKASFRFKGVLKSERIEIKKNCPKCGIEFEISATESEIRRNKIRNFCSRKCSNSRVVSNETKFRISISLKENGNRFQPNTKGVRLKDRKIYEFICLYCGKIGESLRYKKNRKYHLNCAKKCSGGIRKGSSRGKSGWYKGYWCDSSYELAFLIYNIENNIKIERNKEGFEYEYKNEKHLFYPDFLVNGEYVEIKNFRSELTDCKIRFFPCEIRVIYNGEIKPYLDYSKNKYGKDFIKLYEKNV